MESRLLFSFEERICGEVVGDDVGESWSSLLHPGGGHYYGTEDCEDTAELEGRSHLSLTDTGLVVSLLHRGQWPPVRQSDTGLIVSL